MLTSAVVFIAVLGLLVFVHELGHFLVARLAGVPVVEFAFGFRPRLWGRKIGATTYAINLIPLGGYVRFETDDQGALRSVKLGWRLLILAAGSLMNLLTAVVIFAGLFIFGFNSIIPGLEDNPFISAPIGVRIEATAPGSPAAEANLAGKLVLAVNSQEVRGERQFVQAVNAHKGELVDLTISENDQLSQVPVLARPVPPVGEGPLGVSVGAAGVYRAKSVILAPVAAVWQTGQLSWLSLKSVGSFVAQAVVQRQVSDDVTGLIGVGFVTSAASKLGWEYLAQVVAIISVGLGVINLVPILPLDGGHLLVSTYEGVTKRTLSEKQFNTLAVIGLVLIGLLFVTVTAKDIMRFNLLSIFNR